MWRTTAHTLIYSACLLYQCRSVSSPSALSSSSLSLAGPCSLLATSRLLVMTRVLRCVCLKLVALLSVMVRVAWITFYFSFWFEIGSGRLMRSFDGEQCVNAAEIVGLFLHCLVLQLAPYSSSLKELVVLMAALVLLSGVHSLLLRKKMPKWCPSQSMALISLCLEGKSSACAVALMCICTSMSHLTVLYFLHKSYAERARRPSRTQLDDALSTMACE